MNEEKYTFTQFLGRTWWFFLIAFSHAFRGVQNSSFTGSTIGDIFVSIGIILAILFAYWFIRYGRKQ